jgi:hypothetical protein
VPSDLVYPPTQTLSREPGAGSGLLSECEYLFERGRDFRDSVTLARSSFQLRDLL